MVEVSVIIPNYNHARFLQKRIESVLNQTFTGFEIILLDDASTDGSVAVLNTYLSNPKVTHIEINDINSGSPFLQWEKGIKLARGKYIWIAESDDYASTTFLEKSVMALRRYPQASFCFSGSHCIDEGDHAIPKDYDRWTSKQLKCAEGMRAFDGLEYILHNLYWRNYIYNASGVVFRKDCFVKIPDKNYSSMRYSGDWYFWVEMARQGQVVELYEKLNVFRIHSLSTTNKGNASGDSLMEDLQVLCHIESLFSAINGNKKLLRHGIFYKNIRRSAISPEKRLYIVSEYKKRMNHTAHAYLYERLSKLLSKLNPWMLTRERDRL